MPLKSIKFVLSMDNDKSMQNNDSVQVGDKIFYW